jgi:pimeloyl-ACP methyl ester carboxylesterase
MDNLIAAVLDWISENEGILSGILAIAGLTGLVVAGARRLMPRLRSNRLDSSAESATPAIDQEIRYCRTSDGKRIAYAAVGEGTPVVRVMGWFSHLEAEWSSPLGRGFWQQLAGEHKLVRYDGRGIGLSETTTDFSAENRLKDLEAVIDAAEIDQFALMGLSEGSRTALRYIAKHPDRVSHLILYGSAVWKVPNGASDTRKEFRAQSAMIEAGWGKQSHRKFFADLFLGQRASAEEIDYFMEIQRHSATPEVASAYYDSLAEAEQGFEYAGEVQVPTLICHPKDDQMVPFQNSIDLATEIPGARLKPLAGDCHYLMLNSEHSQAGEFLSAIDAFLRDAE